MILSPTQQISVARNLTPGQLISMEIADLSPQMIGSLSSTQIAEFTLSQWRALTPIQMTGLTRSQIEILVSLNPDGLSQLIEPSGLAGWSCAQFTALSLDALEAIPPLMLARGLHQNYC